MTSPARSTRTLEDRARFGLGTDSQDDSDKALTAEGVVEDSTIDVDAANIVVDSTDLTGTATDLQGVLEELDATADAAAASAAAALQVTSLDGNDGDPATYTFTGGAVGDVVIAVLHVSTKADVATIAVEDPGDYAITADTLTGPGTDFTNDQLIVIWADLT